MGTPVQLPPFDLHLGVSLAWTKTNVGKRIYHGGSFVSTDSAAISPATGPFTWQVGLATVIWVLGNTGDVVNVAGE